MKPKNSLVKLSGIPDGMAVCERVKLELNEVSDLVGKLLTLADASFQDIKQREAVKSLIKQIVWDWGNDWHLGATEEELEQMQKDAELCDNPIEPQIKHLDS